MAAAIVLTGGASSRMGADKATLVVDGLAMAERLQLVLAEASVDDVVEAGSLACPDDDDELQGPMAGIVSGWRYLQSNSSEVPDPVVVLSCDLPRLGASLVNQLIELAFEHPDGAVAHDGDRMQPLIAAYRPRALQTLTAAFDAGERSVRRCFPQLEIGMLYCDPAEIADADTPADLADHDVLWPSKHT